MTTTNTKTISLDVNTIDTAEDVDSAADHITFRVTQTGESFTVRTFVDASQDGFGTLSSDTTKTFPTGRAPDWRLSALKFEDNKLMLLGQDRTPDKIITLDQLVKANATSRFAMDKQQLDKEIAENAGVLGGLRDDATLDSSLGATGLNAKDMQGIGGLIGTKGTQIGSGGLGARGSGLGSGGTAEGLGGLGTKGRGSGASGYGSGGGNFGTAGIGGIGTVGNDPIILGALDKSLIDAVIKRNMAQIRYCYQRELTKNPMLGGRIVVKFVIAKDGTVSSATIRSTTMNNEKVEQAICGRFLKFQFPEPKGGGIVIVSYPFIFSPG